MIKTTVSVASIAACVMSASADPTTVSLQGRLSDNGSPLDGPATLRLSLFDDADVLVGSRVDLDGDGITQGADEDVIIRSVVFDDGKFEVAFGPLSPSAFDGTDRFLQIEVDGVALSRVPFRATPGVSEVMVSPDGSKQIVLTSQSGGVVIGGENATARLDVRPQAVDAVSGAGLIQAVTSNGDGTSTINGAAGFSGNVQPGDVLIASSNGSRILLGMVLVVNPDNSLLMDFDPPVVPASGSTFEVRQPVLRIGANQNPEAYADGQPRTGLVVTDDGRVGVNTTAPVGELDVQGTLAVSVDTSVGGSTVIGGDVSVGGSASVNGALVADSIDVNALAGAFAYTIPGAADNQTQGVIEIGEFVIQWGRYNGGGSGSTVSLAVPMTGAYSVTLSTSTFRRAIEADSFTASSFIVKSTEASLDNDNPAGSGGSWQVIGRRAP